MEKTQISADSHGHAAPRVAVIVPAYGVAHLVGEALASLQAQAFVDWECVVIDDGASDDVEAAVTPFLGDCRIRFLSTENRGVSAARNRAIAETSAPLVTLLDGDDRLLPHYFSTMVPLLEGNPHIRVGSCNAWIFGAVPKERLCFERVQGSDGTGRGTLSDVLDRSFGIYIGSTFRRADFVAVGGFDESMAQSEDFDFWVRLMLLGGHAWYVDDVLGEYRVRAGSASSNMIRLLQGNIRVYKKARAAIPDQSSEAKLIDRLLAMQNKRLTFELAIVRVIDGDTRGGLSDLRSTGTFSNSWIWSLSLGLWRLFPGLARPMLRWRRQSHARGASETGLFATLTSILG